MQPAGYWLPRGLGLLAFALYAWLAPPGFFWLDSAELSAASVGLGSSHPTGFPLYMMLGKVASLVPVGEIAFRLNLLSAACAAVAVAGVARLILRVGQNDWPSLAGALAGAGTLMVALLFARQATVAEVYAPTAALLVISLQLFDAVARGGSAGAGLSLAWVAGLGFGLHPSYRLLMGLPILLLLVRRLYRGARWPLLAPALTALGALASYLYLPVRSSTGRVAALDWGHPRTLEATWSHANASGIRKAFSDQMFSDRGDIVVHDLLTFAAQLGDHLGLLCVLAAAAGAVVLLRERKCRWLGGALVACFGIDFVYSFWINPMGLVDLQNGVPAALCMCVCAGVAVAALARATGPAAPFAGGAAALALILPPALLGLSAVAKVGDLPRRLSEHALLPIEPGAVLFTQSDSLAAGTLFLSTVEGARPDVAPLVISMLVDRERVRELIDATRFPGESLPEDWSRPVPAVIETGRPVYWEHGAFSAPGPGLELGALVSRVVDSPRPENVARAIAELGELYAVEGHRDRSARRTLASSLTHLGRVAYGKGDLAQAESLFRSAVEVRAEHAAAWTNLGVVLASQGRLEDAAAASERALDDAPNRQVALVNAARYRMQLGDLERASAHAERALRVAPEKASSWNIAGLVDLRAGNPSRARERLLRALALAPGLAEARAALSEIAADAPSGESSDGGEAE